MAGRVVVLNGPPRAGKSSIARALQERVEGTWVNLGVDVARTTTPPHLQPGIGLRPGEPSHRAAPFVPTLFSALFESIAAHSRLGLDVVADLGIHQPAIWGDMRARLAGLPLLTVGVRCAPEAIAARRAAGGYPSDLATVERWERVVHEHAYDLEVETTQQTPETCADLIAAALPAG